MSHLLKPLIVIPVYNHGATLAEVVTGALSTGLQVLVVDDGSTDKCLQRIKGLACLTIRLEKNRGKGAAILAGAELAAKNNYTVIIVIDADGQHNPEDIPLLIAEAEKHPGPAAVIGARRMVQDTIPQASHFGKHFSNFWVHLECGCELPDTQSGFRLYPVRELLQLNVKSRRYDFEIESLVKLAWAGVTLSSVSVEVHYPPKNSRISHFHKIKDNLRLTLLHSSLVARRLMPWPHRKLTARESLRQKVKNSLHKNPLKTLRGICREHTSPFWLATAVWLGIFMGALPLLACHTVAIIYVAHRLHLNIVAGVAASQFCMPPVVPVLCIQAGYFMRKGEFLLDFSWQRWLLEVHQRLYEWLLGSLVVGPILGLTGAAVMYWTASRIQKHNQLKSTSII